MASNGARQPSTRQALAWSVHLFTASGAVLAVFALWEIGRGGFARAAIYMLAALAIDSVDGTLARRVGVAERLPRIDGRTLDDVVDYLNYAIVPVVFLLALGSFVHWSLAVLPVLASAYGFAQVDAKTEDDFFLGWPSYWNVVALYVWLLELSPAAASAWVALFTALIFVPLKYIYPSKLRRLRAVTAVGRHALGDRDGADRARCRRAPRARAPPSSRSSSPPGTSRCRPGSAIGGGCWTRIDEPAARRAADQSRHPDAPRPREVRRYLREFLSDPRVIDLPAAAAQLLLEGWILPTRPRRTAAAYAKVWSEAGSPLLVHGQALRAALARRSARAGPSRSGCATAARRSATRCAGSRSAACARSSRCRSSRSIRRPRPAPRSRRCSRSPRPRGCGGSSRSGRSTTTRASSRPGATSPRPRSPASAPITCCSRITACPSARSAPRTERRHCLASADCCVRPSAAHRHCYRAQCFATTAALVAALGLDAGAHLDVVPVAARAHAVDPAVHRLRAARARGRGRAPPRDPVPVVRRRLPRDGRGDRHPRARAVARARRRGAPARRLPERPPDLGRGGRAARASRERHRGSARDAAATPEASESDTDTPAT